LPLAESLRRRGHRPADRIEASGEAFLARVSAGFSALARQEGWASIDASLPPEQVALLLQEALEARLSRHG
jgi:dTMP kinase